MAGKVLDFLPEPLEQGEVSQMSTGLGSSSQTAQGGFILPVASVCGISSRSWDGRAGEELSAPVYILGSTGIKPTEEMSQERLSLAQALFRNKSCRAAMGRLFPGCWWVFPRTKCLGRGRSMDPSPG